MYSIGSDVTNPSPAQPTPQNTPAIVAKSRGPMRSISQPCAGCTHVWNRMKSVNAHWMSDTFHPVACCIGLTKSVHEYCRLAIITIAITATTNWNQRF